MEKVESFCTDCNAALENGAIKCNSCGSDKKTIRLLVEDEISLYDQVKIKSKGKIDGRKIYHQLIKGHESSADGNMVDKLRIINNIDNVYFEEIKDLDGNVIHKCQEKLSEHKGHGSAKKKNAE
jgi:hypothetical protein